MSDEDTSEYPIERDGQRRRGEDRRSGERFKRQAKRVLGWASGLAAVFYCVTELARFGSGAFHLAVAAEQLNATVQVLAPEVAQLKAGEDSLLLGQGLTSRHLAKLDTITMQEQRAIQALSVRVDKGKRP